MERKFAVIIRLKNDADRLKRNGQVLTKFFETQTMATQTAKTYQEDEDTAEVTVWERVRI